MKTLLTAAPASTPVLRAKNISRFASDTMIPTVSELGVGPADYEGRGAVHAASDPLTAPCPISP